VRKQFRIAFFFTLTIGEYTLADSAFQTEYRQAFIHGFEDMDSRLRKTVTTHTEIKGNAAVFLVATSGSATAVPRGVNGLITARADSLTQTTATLAEWHKPIVLH